jgi:hypothetical protein
MLVSYLRGVVTCGDQVADFVERSTGARRDETHRPGSVLWTRRGCIETRRPGPVLWTRRGQVRSKNAASSVTVFSRQTLLGSNDDRNISVGNI